MSNIINIESSLQRRIAILGAMGGSIFDYYIDKKIKKINIYADFYYIQTLASLYEQAFWLGIEIATVYSTVEKELMLDFLEKNVNRKIKVCNIAKEKIDDTPFITIGVCKMNLKGEHYSFTELLYYSRLKRVIFDKVLKYKDSYAKDLKVVVFTFPDSHNIKNANEWEKNARGETRTDSEKLPEFYRQLGFCENEIELLTKQRWKFGVFERNGVFFLKDLKYQHINVTGGLDFPRNNRQ